MCAWCRLEIEAEPWMEGVLEALLGILLPSTATTVTEETAAPAENHLPTAQTAVLIDQSAADCTVEIETSIQSDLKSDIGDSQRTEEDMSENSRTPAKLQSASNKISDSVDVNIPRSEISDVYNGPPQLQHNVILESQSVNCVVVNEEEQTDVITEQSLTHSSPPMSTVPLTVPLCPPRYLKLTYLPDEKSVSRISQRYITVIKQSDFFYRK